MQAHRLMVERLWKDRTLTFNSTIPDNGPTSKKWAILQAKEGTFADYDFQVFLNPVHHGLAASYMQDVRKGYKGPGKFFMVEVKEIVEVTE